MAFLIGTSVLVRLANATDAQHPVAARAVLELHRRGELLHLAPQCPIDFRNMATRPTAVNGLGLAAAAAAAEAATFETLFSLLSETPSIYPAWKALVDAAGVIGKQVHDARLLAVCHAEGISHLLTFNTRHFVSLAGFGPGVVVIHPATV